MTQRQWSSKRHVPELCSKWTLFPTSLKSVENRLKTGWKLLGKAWKPWKPEIIYIKKKKAFIPLFSLYIWTPVFMVFKVFPIVFNRFSNGFQRFSNNCRIWLNVTLETSVSEIFVGVRAHLAHNALTLLKRSYRKDCTVLTGIIFSNLGPAAMGACGIGSFCFSNLQKIICQQLGTAR